MKCIQLASYSYLNRQIEYLSEQIAIKMGNRIETGTPIHSNNAALLTMTVNRPPQSSTASAPTEEGDLIQF